MEWLPKPTDAIAREKWSKHLVWLASLCGCLAFVTLVWEIGWPVSAATLKSIRAITWGLVILAALVELALNLLDRKPEHLRRGLILLALPLLAGLQMVLGERTWVFWDTIFPRSSVPYVAMGVVQANLILPTAVRLIRLMRDQRWFQTMSPGLIGVISFVLIIGIGTGLLMTPNASKEGLEWVDALFMSTSAVCVTGLSSVNVETSLTFTGQAILLALIQIGGLGVMTLTYFLALVAGQGFNLRDRVALRDLLSEENLGRVGGFVWHIVGWTLLIEFSGVLLLRWLWQDTHLTPSKLWWDCLFHGISAFCNAGFSTYGDGLMHPSLLHNRGVHTVVMILIVLGGFGFALFSEMGRYGRAWWHRHAKGQELMMPRLSVHCRLAFTSTVLLLVGGAVAYAASGLGVWESIFNSVVTRTAGFNISSFGAHGTAALIISLVLMAIGGNPGGTAGGIKTTTAALIVLEMKRILLGQRDLQLWDRRASRESVERSWATLALCLLWVIVASSLMGWFDPAMAAADIIFECVSAFGTVGLTRGITMQMSDPSKLVVVATMLAGRIGILTFAMSLIGPRKPSKIRMPEARVPLG